MADYNVDTTSLAIPVRSLPTEYIYDTQSGLNQETASMAIPCRGLPATYIYTYTGTPPVASSVGIIGGGLIW